MSSKDIIQEEELGVTGIEMIMNARPQPSRVCPESEGSEKRGARPREEEGGLEKDQGRHSQRKLGTGKVVSRMGPYQQRSKL